MGGAAICMCVCLSMRVCVYLSVSMIAKECWCNCEDGSVCGATLIDSVCVPVFVSGVDVILCNVIAWVC